MISRAFYRLHWWCKDLGDVFWDLCVKTRPKGKSVFWPKDRQ